MIDACTCVVKVLDFGLVAANGAASATTARSNRPASPARRCTHGARASARRADRSAAPTCTRSARHALSPGSRASHRSSERRVAELVTLHASAERPFDLAARREQARQRRAYSARRADRAHDGSLAGRSVRELRRAAARDRAAVEPARAARRVPGCACSPPGIDVVIVVDPGRAARAGLAGDQDRRWAVDRGRDVRTLYQRLRARRSAGVGRRSARRCSSSRLVSSDTGERPRWRVRW